MSSCALLRAVDDDDDDDGTSIAANWPIGHSQLIDQLEIKCSTQLKFGQDFHVLQIDAHLELSPDN